MFHNDWLRYSKSGMGYTHRQDGVRIPLPPIVGKMKYADKVIIEAVVLYTYKTLSFTLRVEHKLRVFRLRVQGGIFGPKRNEISETWRKLHNEELQNLYSLASIRRIVKSRRTRWAGGVA
jgi:hypothetical protein